MEISEYIEKRVNDQISYYDKQSIKYKNCHFFLTVLSIILSSSSAVIILLGSKIEELDILFTILAAISSAIVTILLAVDKLGKYQELYIQYRRTCEELKQELFLYEMSSGEYINGKNESLFVQRCESILTTEIGNWSQLNEQNH